MLTQEQVEAYHAQGYISVEGVFSDTEIEELRRVTDEFVERSRQVTENDEDFDLEPGHSAAGPAPAAAQASRAAAPGVRPHLPRQPHPRQGRAAGRPGHPPLQRQAQHEVGRVRQPGRVAPGLRLLRAHQRGHPRRGGGHRRHEPGERLPAGRPRIAPGADLQPLPGGVLRRGGHRQRLRRRRTRSRWR